MVSSVAGLVMQQSGNLVEVDILELNYLSHHGLVMDCSTTAWDCMGWRMVMELDLKLTQGMVER